MRRKAKSRHPASRFIGRSRVMGLEDGQSGTVGVQLGQGGLELTLGNQRCGLLAESREIDEHTYKTHPIISGRIGDQWPGSATINLLLCLRGMGNEQSRWQWEGNARLARVALGTERTGYTFASHADEMASAREELSRRVASGEARRTAKVLKAIGNR